MWQIIQISSLNKIYFQNFCDVDISFLVANFKNMQKLVTKLCKSSWKFKYFFIYFNFYTIRYWTVTLDMSNEINHIVHSKIIQSKVELKYAEYNFFVSIVLYVHLFFGAQNQAKIMGLVISKINCKDLMYQVTEPIPWNVYIYSWMIGSGRKHSI